MSRNCAAALAVVLLSLTTVYAWEDGETQNADANTAPSYGTVNLYFLNRFVASDESDSKSRAAVGGGGFGGGGFAIHSDVLRIHIDGEFVGHALLRHVDVNPTLKLSSGHHAFRIECNGYKPFESKLNVLGNGSTQWLVLKLEPLTNTADHKSNSTDTPKP